MKKKEASWYIDNALKPPKAFFDWCYSNIPTYKWSNKKETILASERKNCEVIEKRLTKNSKLTFDDKFSSYCIVLVTAKRIEIQTHCFWSSVENGKQIIEQELTNLQSLTKDEHIQVGKWWNGYSMGLVPLVPMGGHYTGVEYFQNDWKEKIHTISELKYIDFSNYTDLNLHHLSYLYKYRREIEFLQKINATKISMQLMRGEGIDFRVFNQKWLKENKAQLKNSKLSFQHFELDRRIRNRGGKIVPGINEYMTYQDINHVPKNVGIVKFQNWVIKNKIDISYYRDYITTLNDIGIKADTSKIIMPENLVEAHDEAVKVYIILEPEIRARKEAKLNAKEKRKKEKEELEHADQFKKRLKQIRKYETTIDGYAFVVPKKMSDIVNEGSRLSHCVGNSNYMKNHREGITTIIFVRDENNIDNPLCTLEYRNKKIIQLQGYKNKSKNVPEGVREAADKWLTWVNGGCKRGKNKVESKEEEAPAA